VASLVAIMLVAAVLAAMPAAASAEEAGARSAAGPSTLTSVSARSSLSGSERAASLVLARARARFLARYAGDPDRPFTASFFSIRRELHTSALYRALHLMPKGGLLHVHASGIGDALWVVDRALAEPHSYIYWGDDAGDFVHGELAVYPHDDPPAGFVSAALLRQSVPDLRARLFRLLTLGPEDASVPDIWAEFEAIFQRLDAFVSYEPVFVDYYRRSFLTLARDGVQFVEIHTSVDELSTPSGGVIQDLDVLAAYRRALAAVRVRFPSFGLRIILCTWRGATLEEAAAQLARERALSAAAPGIVHGFDIVAHEDGGNSNGFYAPVLTTLPRVPLYLHAGESLSAADTNIQDALDLGARRIGHGLNMDLFPGLEQRVRDAGVTVEVCPVSNQTLRYVPDLRRHPARGWLRRGTRVALGSDDPSIFGTSGLSDDFAMAYLSWHLSLRTLKQLALRSITSSTLPRERRERQRTLFERRWDRWVADVAGVAAAR
jgi:adenosine deaminase CECR1